MMQTISTQSLGTQQSADFSIDTEGDSSSSSQFGEFLTEAKASQTKQTPSHTREKAETKSLNHGQVETADNADEDGALVQSVGDKQSVSTVITDDSGNQNSDELAVDQAVWNVGSSTNTATIVHTTMAQRAENEQTTEITDKELLESGKIATTITPERAVLPTSLADKLVQPNTPQIHPKKPDDLIEIDIIPPDYIVDDLAVVAPKSENVQGASSTATNKITDARVVKTALNVDGALKDTLNESAVNTDVLDETLAKVQGVPTDAVLAKKSIFSDMIANSQATTTGISTPTKQPAVNPTPIAELVSASVQNSAELKVVSSQVNVDETIMPKSQFASELLAQLQATSTTKLSVNGVDAQASQKVESLNLTPELASNKFTLSDDKLQQLNVYLDDLSAKLANMSDLEKQGALKVAMPILDKLAVNDPDVASKIEHFKQLLSKIDAENDVKFSALEKNMPTLPVIQPVNKNPLPTNKGGQSAEAVVGEIAKKDIAESEIELKQIDAAQEIKISENKAPLSTVSTPKPVQTFVGIINQINDLANSETNKVVSEQQLLDIQRTETAVTTQRHNVEQGKLAQVLEQAVNITKSDAAKALYSKTAMLVALGKQEAEIRLDPPELGSMQIRIRSDAEQAQLNFVVQNQQAKELLEQSMGRLREMLAQSGIALGEASVEQGPSHGGEQNAHQQKGVAASDPQGNDAQAPEIVQKSTSRADGIDFYA